MDESRDECCICLQSNKYSTVQASEQSFNKLLEVCHKWLRLETEVEQKSSSSRILRLQSTLTGSKRKIIILYHRQCYQRFTDKCRIERIADKEKKARKVN